MYIQNLIGGGHLKDTSPANMYVTDAWDMQSDLSLLETYTASHLHGFALRQAYDYLQGQEDIYSAPGQVHPVNSMLVSPFIVASDSSVSLGLSGGNTRESQPH